MSIYTLIAYKPNSFTSCHDHYSSDHHIFMTDDVNKLTDKIAKLKAIELDYQEEGYTFVILKNGYILQSQSVENIEVDSTVLVSAACMPPFDYDGIMNYADEKAKDLRKWALEKKLQKEQEEKAEKEQEEKELRRIQFEKLKKEFE